MNIYNIKSSIQSFNHTDDFHLYIKEEGKSFCSFGTKLRKFSGLIDYINKENINEILIHGNPHSNFVSTYSTLFKIERKNITSIHYTKDNNLKTINSILSKKNSDRIINVNSKSNKDFYIAEFKKDFPNGFILPEFGIHESSIASLNLLWEEIRELKYDYLFLDIGTGFTALSAANYFKDSNLKIIGVCIGADFPKMEKYLSNVCNQLNLDKKIVQKIDLLPCLISKSFGSVNNELIIWMNKIYEEKNIYLEPIYSAKTSFTVFKYTKKAKLKGTGVYIHQGGMLNHLKYFNAL